MPISNRQKWSYPDENSEPWFLVYDGQIQAQDASVYALRETLNTLVMNGGTFTFSAVGNSLDWSSVIDVLAAPTGRLWQAPAGGVTLAEGEMAFMTVTRSPVQNVGITVETAAVLPDVLRDDRIVLAVRRGDRCYFRNGAVLQAESSSEVFQSGDSSTKAYERTDTFVVPLGGSTTEVTYGRILFDGSIVGLSAELTRTLTAGTVTVNLKVNAVIATTIVIDLSDPDFKQIIFPAGTIEVLASDQVSVEVIAVGYANTAALAADLVVNVALLAQGLVFNLATVANASSLVKGVTKLSVDPAVATDPIALGANDPTVVKTDALQVHTRAIGSETSVLVEAPTVAVNAGLSNSFKLTLTANRAMGNPTPMQDGFVYRFRIIQDGVGGHNLTYGSAWKFPGGTLPDFSVAGPGDANAVSIIRGESDGTNLFCTVELDFS